jgi:response regulator RpfG family c-di-GMP phosphodiesterase
VEPRSSYARLEELVWHFAETMARSSDALLALAAGEGRHGAVFPHSLTVALLVLGHARRLGIQAPALQEIGLGALLHDIGKLHLPPHLVEAHGRLGDEDWGELRRHPEVGAAAIVAVPAAGPEAVLIAFEHHLRFDGRPNFPPLTRPRRPGLGAQITAVSDSWDNVLTQIGELPPALAAAAPAAAAQILRDRAGTYLNPFLVEDFLGWLGA